MGAVILPLMALYLGLLIWASGYGWRWARRRNYSTAKRAFCAFGGFLIVYLPLMWDWIPTELAHRYYCKKEAGLWIYKTLDQWKAENPGVWETLTVDDKNISRDGGSVNYKDTIRLNQRIDYSITRIKISSLLSIFKKSHQIIDTENEDVLGVYVNLSYGYPGRIALGVLPGDGLSGYKFWMVKTYCANNVLNEEIFSNFLDSFKGVEK